MDEAFGWALYYQQLPAMTARVETRFQKPIQVRNQSHREGVGRAARGAGYLNCVRRCERKKSGICWLTLTH